MHTITGHIMVLVMCFCSLVFVYIQQVDVRVLSDYDRSRSSLSSPVPSAARLHVLVPSVLVLELRFVQFGSDVLLSSVVIPL